MQPIINALTKFAPLLGASLTFLLLAFAIAAYFFQRDKYHSRNEAIKRANPEDLPAMIDDELLDKLGLKADGLSKRDKFDLVKTVLNQREQRSKRSFSYLLVVSFLVFVLVIVTANRSPTSGSNSWRGQYSKLSQVKRVFSQCKVLSNLRVPQGTILEMERNSYLITLTD